MQEKNNLTLEKNNGLISLEEYSENYTLIEINQRTYAIKTKNVLEIVKVMELEFPSKLPTSVLGLIKYNNIPVGVIDLREIFKNKRITYDLNSKIIVLKAKNSIISIICDKVIDIKKLSIDNIHPVPYKQENKFWEGIYIDKIENAYIIDVDGIANYVEQNSNEFQSEQEASKYIVSDDESKEILKDRKEFLVKITTDIEPTTPLYDMGVSFIINNIKYYINMASVKEFHKINDAKFIKIPSCPDYIFGLINIKGDYITVVDIRKLFNTSKTEVKEKSTIIILNSDEYKIGILADEICENININFEELIQNKIQNKDDNKMSEFVKDGEIYQVLDIEKLLKDERLTIC